MLFTSKQQIYSQNFEFNILFQFYFFFPQFFSVSQNMILFSKCNVKNFYSDNIKLFNN